MIGKRVRYPGVRSDLPAFVLVHGAANSAQVFALWQEELAELGAESHAIDLRGHGEDAEPIDLSRVSMRDYADDVREAMRELEAPPVLVGWSMGGLVAMMAASAGGAVACVGLAPSTPARERDASMPLRSGTFGPEEYGTTSRDPAHQPAMPDLDFDERESALASLCRESRYARDERAAGIVVPALDCPLLVVTGGADTQWPRSRYDGFPLPADFIDVPGSSHWGLVLSRRALTTLVPQVVGWAPP